jgi:hypothetical protein
VLPPEQDDTTTSIMIQTTWGQANIT